MSNEPKNNTRTTGNLANLDYYKPYLKKDSSFFSHGIDYLTYSLTKKQTDILNPFLLGNVFINDSNTNELLTRLNTNDLFHVTSTRASNGTAYNFSIVYESIPVSIFQFILYSDVYKDTFHINSSLKFYGGYYRMLLLGDVIPKSLLDYLDDFVKPCLISRIDYRYDFLFKDRIDIPLITEILPKKRKDKKRKPYYTGENLESWDCGRKVNKTTFIRLYDKNIELVKKLKGIYLYGDILKAGFKTFHRLEYEFGQKFTKGFTGAELPILLQKVNKVSGLHPSSFVGNMYKPQRVSDLTNEFDRNRYIRIFKSMARNLTLNGLDPKLLFSDNEYCYDNKDIIKNIENELKLLGLKEYTGKFINDLKKILQKDIKEKIKIRKNV